MSAFLASVSIMQTLSGIDFDQFYKLTYWGLGLSAVVLIIVLITTDDDTRSGCVTALIIVTVLIVGAVEIYHSKDRQELAIKRYKEEQEKEARDKRKREYGLESCRFESAKQKADDFVKSNGFIIVKTNTPYYETNDAQNTYRFDCIAHFSYVVKVRQYNQTTGQTSIRNRLYNLNLMLQKFDFAYEFIYAKIEDPSTGKSQDLLN